jgi:hypothetical protein
MAGADLYRVLCISKKTLGTRKVLIGLATCVISVVWLARTVPLNRIERGPLSGQRFFCGVLSEMASCNESAQN